VTSQRVISELKSALLSFKRVMGTVVSRMIESEKMEEIFPARSLNLIYFDIYGWVISKN